VAYIRIYHVFELNPINSRRVRSRTSIVRSEGFGDNFPNKQQTICTKQIRLFCMCVITHALLATIVSEGKTLIESDVEFLPLLKLQ